MKRILIYQSWDVNNLGHYLNREVKYNRPTNFKQEEDDSSKEFFNLQQSEKYFLSFMETNNAGFEESFHNISTFTSSMSRK